MLHLKEIDRFKANLNTLTTELQSFIKKKGGQAVQTSSSQHHFHYLHCFRSDKSFKIELKVTKLKSWKFYWYIAFNDTKYGLGQAKVHQIVNHINKSQNLMNYKLCFDAVQKQLMAMLIIEEEIMINLQFQEFSSFITGQLQMRQSQFIKCFLKLVKSAKQNPKKNLKVIREKINEAKLIIDEEIKKREKNTLPNFVSYIVDTGSPNTTVHEEKNKSPGIHEQIQQIYRKELLDDKKSGEKILQKIKILQRKIDPSWVEPDSGHGTLQKYYVKYYKQSSIHENTNEIMNIEPEKLALEDSYLVEKRTKEINKEVSLSSFNNEIALLKYMRDKSQPTIASFFIDKKVSRFFIRFYPKHSGEHSFKERDWITFIKKLGRALNFLQENYIVHRDLKPNNIMMSHNLQPKLIDFGSSVLKVDCPQSSKITKALRTTVHYNLTHKNLVCGDMFEEEEFDEHKYFDMYAFGMIVKGLITNDLPMGIRKDFDWIYQRATDRNPYNRINGKQAVLYCYFLEKQWKLEKKMNN